MGTTGLTRKGRARLAPAALLPAANHLLGVGGGARGEQYEMCCGVAVWGVASCGSLPNSRGQRTAALGSHTNPNALQLPPPIDPMLV